VTTELQVAVFPFTSVTRSVTLLVPTLAQLKVLGVTLILAIPQLSKLPLFTCAGTMEAKPPELSGTVILLHSAVGGMLSF